jgi:hypothetical protein
MSSLTDRQLGRSSAQSPEFPRLHEQSGQGAASPYMHHSPQPMVTDRSHTGDPPYWRSHENTMPDSHPLSCVPLPPQPSEGQLPTSGSQGELRWHLPQPSVRLTSFNTPGEIPPQYPAEYYRNVPVDFERRMTMPLGLPGQTLSSMHSTMPQDHAASAMPYEHMTTIMPYEVPGSWSWALPPVTAQMTRSEQEGYPEAGYNNPASLPQVREEDSVLQQQGYQHSMRHPYHPG